MKTTHEVSSPHPKEVKIILICVQSTLRPRRIRIVFHNPSDKVILPRLFQIWRQRKQVMQFCTKLKCGNRTPAGPTYYDGLSFASV